MGKLTVSNLQRAKPKDRDYKLTDGAGLYLFVLTSGGRSWRLDYRFGGKRKTLTLGRYPHVDLMAARNLAAEAHVKLAQGIDPGIERKILLASAYLNSSDTFEAVAREWAEINLGDKSKSHRTRSTALLENDLIPMLGGIPMRDLNPVLLLGALRRVENRSIDMSHRAKALAGQILRFAVATGRAERDFSSDLRGALRSRRQNHYPAITDPSEFVRLMLAIDYYQGTLTVCNALKISPLLMLRPGELRHMTWEHINWEAEQLEFPAEYMKTKDRPHIVPLSRQALEILREQQRFNGSFQPVFPSGHGRNNFMSENGPRTALRVMGYANSVHTVHGFRASSRTIMEEVLGERPDLLEMQLHHMVRDTNGMAYNRTRHLDARREMLQRWADWIDAQKSRLNTNNG